MISQNRSYNHRILRRLGVKDNKFWFVNWLFMIIPTMISCIICGIIWHYFGILPFSQVTIPFVCSVMSLTAFIIVASVMVIASLLGRNLILPFIGTSIVVMLMIVLPGILHTTMF